MKTLKQSLVIILSILCIFVIVNSSLSSSMAIILGILIGISLLYIVIKRRRKTDEEIFVGSYIEFFAITVGILLIIFITGGFYSTVFFLVYFLLFGISFMFEPPTVFVFMIGLLVLFIEQALAGNVFINLVRLASLVLLAPIAFFFGNEFKKREKLEQEVKKDTEIISKQTDQLKKDTSLKKETIEAIENATNDIKKNIDRYK